MAKKTEHRIGWTFRPISPSDIDTALSGPEFDAFMDRWIGRTDAEKENSVEQDNGFIPVVIEDGDFATMGQKCPHCHQAFAANTVILDSYDQKVQIHAECVVEMFRRLPGNRAVIAEEFERRRIELLDDDGTIDE